MRIAIVGAGLAGLACATRLVGAAHRVTLFDKSRGAGGRMATRRLATPHGEAGFDHGAQYLTAHDPGFQAQVRSWAEAGLVAPWFAAGADRFVGVPTMNAPLRQLSAALDVRSLQRIDRLEQAADGWHLHGDGIAAAGPYDAVLVALPAEQAAGLLRDVEEDFAGRAAGTRSAPCWTAMAAFADRLPVAADVLQCCGALDWAARNSAKPGRTGPEAWVLQAAPDWSTTHLEAAPDAVLQALLGMFAAATGIVVPAPLAASAHRWRHARSGAAGDGLLWNPARRLGVCGDWLLGPHVECAWLSGTRLAAAVMETG